MIIEQALQHIASKLNERQEELKEFLGQGAAKDYAEYKSICGTIHGLETAKNLLNDHAKRLENDDDE